MPIKAKELTALEVKRLTEAKRYSVGGVAGLHLQVRASGGKSWLLRVKVGNKRREIGLGGYPDVTLAQARERAREQRLLIEQGTDPIEARKQAHSELVREQSRAIVFEDLARAYITRKTKEYRRPKQGQTLSNQFDTHVFPFIGSMLVADIEMVDIISLLTPIWETKTETAIKIRQHLEKILDMAIIDGKREGLNPAKWKGALEHSTLPAPSKISNTKHLAAVPVAEMSLFWSRLKHANGMGARALKFIILTCTRSWEARGAEWDEIDFENRVWIVPAERMKTKKQHSIPLSDEAIALLEQTPRLGKYIFAGARGGTISDTMVSKVPKTLGYKVTAHGFRSTFKDWARMHTEYADEISELALSHVNDDRTRAAYARDGLLDKRRLMMQDWSQFISSFQAQS